MPYDPSGVYSLVSTYYVEVGYDILPEQHNPVFEDISAALSGVLLRDGRAPMTGNLNMDSNRIVGLADGVANGDAANVGQMDAAIAAGAALAVPSGAIMPFARDSAPNGWLECRGQAVSRTTYAALFAAIGTTFGTGNGSSTFNLPNMRGQFVRGWNETSSGLDSGRAFGSTQDSQNLQHNHSASTGSAGNHSHSASTGSAGNHSHSGTTASSGSHSHSGSTNTTGNHSHSASTNSAGSHSHTVEGRGGQSTNPGGGATVPTGSDSWQSLSSTFRTASAGGHSHTVTVGSNGNHSHTLSINDAGAHTHTLSTNSTGAHTHTVSVSDAGAHTHGVTVNNSGGSEARPHNIALLYCIKV